MMTRRSKLAIGLALAAGMAGFSQAANASTYVFTVVGSTTYTFDLPSNPTPLGVDTNGLTDFYLAAPPSLPTSFVTFYSSAEGGGMSAGTDVDDNIGFDLFDIGGAQLYSGPETSPQFILGTYDLTPFGLNGTFGNAIVTISQESPTATPLPAAVPLFASGLGALSLLGWRKRRKAAAAAA